MSSSRVPTPLTSRADALLAVFSPGLAPWRFCLDSREVVQDHIDLVFRQGQRFIRISANFGPEQAPFALGCHLGEGHQAWPESDWNSVSLWRMADAQERGAGDGVYDALAYGADAGPAEFQGLAQVCCAALQEFAAAFLNGNLAAFYRQRAAINAARQPYRSVSLAADGSMQVVVDQQSEALRQKFSQVPTP